VHALKKQHWNMLYPDSYNKTLKNAINCQVELSLQWSFQGRFYNSATLPVALPRLSKHDRSLRRETGIHYLHKLIIVRFVYPNVKAINKLITEHWSYIRYKFSDQTTLLITKNRHIHFTFSAQQLIFPSACWLFWRNIRPCYYVAILF
jgi:hypothetical protein